MSPSFLKSVNQPTMASESFASYDPQTCSSHRRRSRSFLPTFKSNQQSHRDAHKYPANTSAVGHELGVGSTHNRYDSGGSIVTLAATSRSSTASSMASHSIQGPISPREASLKAQEIQPTSDVATWAHQAHVRQGRSYWWCQGCFPKEVVEPLQIPKAVEKMVTGRRDGINEPSHCYDI